MFDLTNRVVSLFLSRPKAKTIDDNILRIFVDKNKKSVEFAFFKKNLVCSWNSKTKTDNYYCEILYIMAMKGSEVNEQLVQDIFVSEVDNFIEPTYFEYKRYMNMQINSPDIMKNVVLVLSESVPEILTEEEFYTQVRLVKESLRTPFVKELKFDKTNSSTIKKEMKDINQNCADGSLSFMGKYFYIEEIEDLKQIVCFKLLEKLYGTNETDSIYFPLRSEGKIYTAITTYIMEKNIFLTGVLANYSDELYLRVKNMIDHTDLTEEVFESTKNRMLDDLSFVAFQYGELFTLLPYLYTLKGSISMKKIKETMKETTLDDLKLFLQVKKSSIRLGVKND